jgi:hypothetical protein
MPDPLTPNPPLSHQPRSRPYRSIPAAITLFFLTPIVAEFLLGDFPATWLPLLIVIAPMYGGGSLLIREFTRRSGRGWPTILLLGAAYAIIEEAFTTQSLFNTHYLGMHLLAHAWIPSLGISAWWTLFMLNVHPFWSIGVSIALTEGLFPTPAGLYPSPAGLDQSPTPAPQSAPTPQSGPAPWLGPVPWLGPAPWLGNVGLSLAAALFTAGCAFNTRYQFHHDPFRATHAQFLVSALVVVAFTAAAFLISAPAPGRNPSPVPSPWILGGAAFLLGAAVFLAPVQLNWLAVAWILAIDLVFLIGLRLFSQCSAWTPLHTLSVAAGGALEYGVHAFLQPPVVPCPKWVVLPSHILFLALALAVIALAVRRTRSAMLLSSQNPSGS